MKTISILTVILCLGVTAAVSADDKEEKELLSRYGKSDMTLSDTKVHPAYPSEREIVIKAAQAMRDKKEFAPPSWKREEYPHFYEYRIGKPIEVAMLISGGRYDLYYYVVPLFYGNEGLRMIEIYARYQDIRDKDGHYIPTKERKEGAYHFAFGSGKTFTPEPPWYPATHLINEQEAGKLIEKYFNVKVTNRIRAIHGFAPRGSTGWFWYTRIDESFSYQGRTVYGVFVNPYSMVRDDTKVRLEELATKESVGLLAGSLIKDRFYTFERKDIDVYRLEREARDVNPEMTGFKEVSDWPAAEEFRLIPLVPDNQPPDTGNFREPTLLERVRKADAERKKAEKEKAERERAKASQ